MSGDTLIIDAKTTASSPSQRMNGSPSYLEVSFPKAKMSGSALSQAVDRGLVQRVQTLQDGQNTSVRVFILSKPKATLSKTADGYRYAVQMSELAGAPAAAERAAPASSERKPAPAASETKPAPAASQPQAASQPTQPVAAQPPAIKPQPPVAQPRPPVAQPPAAQPQPPVAQPRPSVASSAPSANRQLITVVFQNKPIAEALSELARQAGYSAQVDPSLSGAVNLSLTDVPFEDALNLLLEPYGSSVTSSVAGQSLSVRKVAAAPSTPVQSAPSQDVVFEYYPFSNKDAQKMMDAASKAIPELTYRVDPTLNVLLVQGPREHVIRLGELLKKMSTK